MRIDCLESTFLGAKSLKLLSCLTAVGLWALTASQASTITATVSSTNQQMIKGWGCYAGTDFNLQSTTTLNAIYTYLGVTIIRVQLPASAGNSNGTLNTSALTNLVRIINQASSYGINAYTITAWSPPAHMKGPNTTTKGVASDGVTPEYLLTNQESAYVAYLIQALQYLKSQTGKLPILLSIQNEPDSAPVWDGCCYTISNSTVASWIRVAKATRSALDAASMSSVIVGSPECAALDSNETLLGTGFSMLGTDSQLNQSLGAYAFHSYDASGWSSLKSAIAAYPKNVWITEWSAADPASGTSDLDWTLWAAQRFNADLVDLGAAYWLWWQAWDEIASSNGQALLWTTTSGQSVPNYTRMYAFFKQVWSTVRPGWYVRKVTVSDDAATWSLRLKGNGTGLGWNKVDICGFQNAAGTKSVVIIVNTTNTSKTVSRLSGLAGSSADVYELNAWDGTGQGGMAYKRTLTISNGAITSAGLPSYGVQVIYCH